MKGEAERYVEILQGKVEGRVRVLYRKEKALLAVQK